MHFKGPAMSRYIATTLLALAAAIVTVVELALVDQPGGADAALLAGP